MEDVKTLYTDKDYEEARNKLIPKAAAHATWVCPMGNQDDHWTKHFLRRMDDLAIKAGLVQKGIY